MRDDEGDIDIMPIYLARGVGDAAERTTRLVAMMMPPLEFIISFKSRGRRDGGER